MLWTGVRKTMVGAAVAFLGLILPSLCMAAGEAEAAGGGGGGKNQIIGLAVALAISIAAGCGGIGQAIASAAAFEGMARNPGVQPKIFTSMILGLAFIESLVIYAMLIAFMLLGKI